MWRKPPVGAVLGHVARRNGAVSIADPGPSMKKNDRAAKGLGMHNGTEETRLYRRKNRTADTAKHGVPPPLRNKPSLR